MVAIGDFDANKAPTIERVRELVDRDIDMLGRRFDLFGAGEWSSDVAGWTTVKTADLAVASWMQEAYLWFWPMVKRTSGTSGSVRLLTGARSGNSYTFTNTSYPTDPAEAVALPIVSSSGVLTVELQLYATGGSTAFVSNDDRVACEYRTVDAQ